MNQHPPAHSSFALERGRICFTPLQMDNIYTHFRWNNDPELNRLDSEAPYEEEAFRTFKKRFDRMCNGSIPSHRNFEIHTQDGTLIGVAYVARISSHHQHAQVGITIGDREYWGQGYGRESMRLLLDYCFGEMDLHRVSAETFEYNRAWRELVEGMGFVREGTARDYLYREEQYWDKHNYALLETEYRQRFGKDEEERGRTFRNGRSSPQNGQAGDVSYVGKQSSVAP